MYITLLSWQENKRKRERKKGWIGRQAKTIHHISVWPEDGKQTNETEKYLKLYNQWEVCINKRRPKSACWDGQVNTTES